MNQFFFLLLILFPVLLVAQDADSAAIRQVDSLIRISRELTDKRDFGQALEINTAAEKIAMSRELGMGRESAEYATCCHNRGRVLRKKGDYPESEKYYLEAMAIRKKVLGEEHSDYATSLENLAVLYWIMGRYDKAEPLLLNAKDLREKTKGKEHRSYGAILNNLGILYRKVNQYEKAELFCLESLAIQEKVLGKEHPNYATSLNNLANLYSDMGQYEKAEPLYLESKAIRERTRGKEHSDYAQSLNNLAILYKKLGQYEKVEPLYLEAKDIWEKDRGKEHPGYAWSLSNLASLYLEIGQYEKAEPLCLEAKAIREKALGKEHSDYASSLNKLASLYQETGQYEKAEPLCLESKAIREKALGKEHPHYARSLNNLANLYLDMNQYEKAEPLYLESKAIREKVFGTEHPDYAKNLNNLASLYEEMGQTGKAEPLYLEAKAIREKVLGTEHPDYAKSLASLADLYRVSGQYEKSGAFFLELSALNKRLLKKALHHLSEQELNNYINTFSNEQDKILSFTQFTGDKKMIPVCFNNNLFYKGFLLQSAGRIKQLALSDEGAAEKFYLLKSYQRRLAAQYAQPIAERDSMLVAELESKANGIEKDLARTVAGWDKAKRQVQLQEVQATLQTGEAAVEFVHYRYYDKKETDSIIYAALVLHPGDATPSFIPLFEEKQLDSLLYTRGERRADYVKNLYAVAKRGGHPLLNPQKTLYELIWQPLEEELKNVKTIYFSATGLLHRINLNAIPISDEKIVGDHYRLIGLNSTRQLVISVNVQTTLQNASGKPAQAILYGGIEYEMDSTAIAIANKDYGSNSMVSRGALSFNYADSTHRGGAWTYLKWTDREVEKVESTLSNAGFQTDTRRGYKATEESFKLMGRSLPRASGHNKSPRILHIATHGFFFPDPVPKDKERLVVGDDEPVFKISDHPMIRSGLILAGGNHAWKKGKPIQPDMEDGILTAYEISQMDLSNTKLVVLSACETGLGDIRGNEGVYGLQRAFKIAGAKYLIMSLWQVPDKETAYFMELFYRNLTEKELSIPQAFHATQKELRQNPFASPYEWAGFVLVE